MRVLVSFNIVRTHWILNWDSWFFMRWVPGLTIQGSKLKKVKSSFLRPVKKSSIVANSQHLVAATQLQLHVEGWWQSGFKKEESIQLLHMAWLGNWSSFYVVWPLILPNSLYCAVHFANFKGILGFSVQSIILTDLLGNTWHLLGRVHKVMVFNLRLVDLTLFVLFLCFKVYCLWSLHFRP